METLGEYLHQMRQSKGVRLEDIAARTRINMVYLQALEANAFEKFPSEVTARGFVRSYAACLGINQEETLARFNQWAHPFYRDQEETRHRLSDQVGRVTFQETSRKRVSRSRIGLVLLIGLIMVALYLISSVLLQESPLEPTSVQQEMDNQVSPLDKEPVFTGEPAVNKPALHEEDPEGISIILQDLQDPELLTLSVEATETSWVAVRIDNAMTQEVLLQPGEVILWVAQERFSLDLGNAGGVKVKFNGEPLESLGPSGAVIKNIFLGRD